MFLVGQHLTQYNYDKRTHKFNLKSSKVKEVTSFAVSSGKKYIALAERLNDAHSSVQVSVYNFKTATRVRTLPLTNHKGSIVSLDFSSDGKLVACATSEPDPAIFLWQLEKQRVL